MLSEVRHIVRKVAARTNVPVQRILSRERTVHVVYARKQVIHALRERGRSLHAIARLLKCDHTTVHHALNKLTKVPWHRPRIRHLKCLRPTCWCRILGEQPDSPPPLKVRERKRYLIRYAGADAEYLPKEVLR